MSIVPEIFLGCRGIRTDKRVEELDMENVFAQVEVSVVISAHSTKNVVFEKMKVWMWRFTHEPGYGREVPLNLLMRYGRISTRTRKNRSCRLVGLVLTVVLVFTYPGNTLIR